MKPMTPSEMGRKGASVANSRITREQRIKAAKKGWKTRKQNEKLKASN